MHRRNQRGVAFPSPVAILSIVAIAMAGVTYVATQGEEPTEREVTTVSRPSESTEAPQPQRTVKPQKVEKKEPQVQRGEVYVEVYNNSGITGLAGEVAGTAAQVGWQVVGSDNWYGTIPASTVYYPPRLKEAATMLSRDLGIGRTQPAIGPMRRDRLTVILTADAA